MNDRVRADFPLLERLLDGKPITYLDSAATALKPNAVIDAEREYSLRYTANVHRGKHALSEEASAAFEGARSRIARGLGCDPDQLVFVRGTTEGVNLVAAGLGLTKADTVVAPVGEHHANLIPWMRRATLITLDADPRLPLDLSLVAEALERHRPRVFAFAMASNLTGAVHPAAELCKLARSFGAISVVDAAQGAPHLPIDTQALGADFLAFSGHKMLGPTGIGVLFGRSELLERLEPVNFGGGMVQRVRRDGFTMKRVPHRLEAGTPHISGAIGLAAAFDYLASLGFEALQAHEKRLADALASALAGLPSSEVLMGPAGSRLAIASIVTKSSNVSPERLALALSDNYQIMVRSGFHCAHPAFDWLAMEGGAVRASAYLYNTEAEVLRFGEVLRALLLRFVA